MKKSSRNIVDICAEVRFYAGSITALIQVINDVVRLLSIGSIPMEK